MLRLSRQFPRPRSTPRSFGGGTPPKPALPAGRALSAGHFSAASCSAGLTLPGRPFVRLVEGPSRGLGSVATRLERSGPPGPEAHSPHGLVLAARQGLRGPRKPSRVKDACPAHRSDAAGGLRRVSQEGRGAYAPPFAQRPRDFRLGSRRPPGSTRAEAKASGGTCGPGRLLSPSDPSSAEKGSARGLGLASPHRAWSLGSWLTLCAPSRGELTKDVTRTTPFRPSLRSAHGTVVASPCGVLRSCLRRFMLRKRRPRFPRVCLGGDRLPLGSAAAGRFGRSTGLWVPVCPRRRRRRHAAGLSARRQGESCRPWSFHANFFLSPSRSHFW